MPRHAIAPARDRLQSLVLVVVIVPLLCWLVLRTSHQLWSSAHAETSGLTDLSRALGVSVVFALAAFLLRSATPGASACGGLVCFLLIESAQRLELLSFEKPSIAHSGAIPLASLFLLTFLGTKLGYNRKAQTGLAESRKGRSASQVLANLGVAATAAALAEYVIAPKGWQFGGWNSAVGRAATKHFVASLFIPALAALAEATADTVSSEIGQAFGGTPRLLTTLRSVPPGTDGAITVTGTAAGIAAAAIVTASAVPAVGLSPRQASLALAAGIAGLFVDSLLGATLERRGWINNDLVNLLSTAFAAVITLAFLTRVS